MDIKPSFYYFPKSLEGASKNDIGVIGGTFIKGADKTTPHLEEFDLMLQGAREFYGMKSK